MPPNPSSDAESKGAHTPEPWTYEDCCPNRDEIRGPDGHLICEMSNAIGSNRAADGPFIAAAPETARELEAERALNAELVSFIRDDLCDLADALPHVPSPSAHPLEVQRLALVAKAEAREKGE